MIAPSRTLDKILTRHGKLAEGERPTVLRKLSRKHLPSICRDLGFTHGAEIGVWKGGYSLTLCQAAPNMHMLCVDPWLRYDAWEDGKNSQDADIDAAEAIARKVLAGHNCTIVKNFSVEAAKDVPDGSLDFLHIDGNHLYDPVMADLNAWVPKVKSGGIASGHDMKVSENKPYIQVVAAVRDYTRAHKIEPWFITGADSTPSWFWVKQ